MSMTANGGCRIKRGVIIPNFVDLAYFNRELNSQVSRERLGLSPIAKVICFAGGLAEAKGIRPLIEALAIVKAALPNVVCLMPGSQSTPSGRLTAQLARAVLPILGSGTPRQRIESRIRSLHLEDALRRLPFCAEMPALLAASDVVVFPSIKPHFARPVIEAAAMGKPAVGSDLPGVRELIRHGETGTLVKAGSASDLAEALIAVLTDDVAARSLGEGAFRMACQRFDARHGAAELMNVYDRILA